MLMLPITAISPGAVALKRGSNARCACAGQAAISTRPDNTIAMIARAANRLAPLRLCAAASCANGSNRAVSFTLACAVPMSVASNEVDEPPAVVVIEVGEIVAELGEVVTDAKPQV